MFCFRETLPLVNAQKNTLRARSAGEHIADVILVEFIAQMILKNNENVGNVELELCQ
tara:strand:- start:3934 stop:4104 length:171 start_codon:yes stop_codon:yes gene_type:complete